MFFKNKKKSKRIDQELAAIRATIKENIVRMQIVVETAAESLTISKKSSV